MQRIAILTDYSNSRLMDMRIKLKACLNYTFHTVAVFPMGISNKANYVCNVYVHASVFTTYLIPNTVKWTNMSQFGGNISFIIMDCRYIAGIILMYIHFQFLFNANYSQMHFIDNFYVNTTLIHERYSQKSVRTVLHHHIIPTECIMHENSNVNNMNKCT